MIEKNEAQIEPAMVECAVCRKLMPPTQAVHPEGLDCVLYFCGAGYLAEWEKSREAGWRRFSVCALVLSMTEKGRPPVPSPDGSIPDRWCG